MKQRRRPIQVGDVVRAERARLLREELRDPDIGFAFLPQYRAQGYARDRGIREIFGEVLAQNHSMLSLCQQLGFRLETNPHDQSVVTVRLPLDGTTTN